MHVRNRARVKQHTAVSRRAAIAWRAPHVFSQLSECPVQSNRHFSGQTSSAILKDSTSNKKTVCELRRNCTTCGAFLTHGNHECNKRYCKICSQNRDVGHLCYMRPVKDFLPANANNVLYIFYEFEATQTRPIPTRQKKMCLNSSVCNSFVRDVRKSNTVVSIVDDAAEEGIPFGMIL
jgi:hypothetical protein